jgi:ABC-type antimicrobial peptide transport system permease subunit
MLRNTLKTAWRALRRRPSLTALNVVGLGASLGVALLVLLFLRGQWQLDRFHSDAEQIHRITAMHDGTHYASSPRPLAEALRTADVAGVDAVTRLDRVGETVKLENETALCAGGVATVLFFTLAPSFNGLFVFNLMEITAVTPTSLFEPSALLLVLGVCVVTGLLAGVYPAFVLSSFRPSQAIQVARLNPATTLQDE